jgi:SAM-dependent methyltransferase
VNHMWDERYKNEDYFYGTEANDFLVQVSKMIPARSKILCIGEGEGRNAVFLAEQGHEVNAVDLSVKGRSKALKLADSRGVSINYDISALEDFDFGQDHWDAIVSIFCHLPPAIRTLVHARLFDGLRRGGTFLIEAYTPEQLNYRNGGPPTLDLLYNREILCQDLPGIKWSLLEQRVREIHEGQGHNGLSAVIDGLGLKS